MKGVFLALVLMLAGAWALAQEVDFPQGGNPAIQEWNQRLLGAGVNPTASGANAFEDYRVGTEDLLEIGVFEVPELSRTVRVSASGEISLPLLGAVPVAGLSPMQVEQKLTDLLRRSYVKDPQVSVFLKEYRSDPVSVVGAVKVPGLYYIQREKSLIEVLAMAQGFSEGQQQPGRNIVITHKPHTRWIAKRDNAANEGAGEGGAETAAGPAGQPAGSVEIPVKQLVQSGDPRWNVPIYPGDVVRVVPAGTFYVAGDVNRPGGFTLSDFDNVSVIQALAIAGGTKKSANLKAAVIIRRDPAGNREEEKIDLRKVMKGNDAAVLLGANDILFVPGSISKAAALRGIESAIQVATGVLVWRIP